MRLCDACGHQGRGGKDDKGAIRADNCCAAVADRRGGSSVSDGAVGGQCKQREEHHDDDHDRDLCSRTSRGQPTAMRLATPAISSGGAAAPRLWSPAVAMPATSWTRCGHAGRGDSDCTSARSGFAEGQAEGTSKNESKGNSRGPGDDPDVSSMRKFDGLQTSSSRRLLLWMHAVACLPWFAKAIRSWTSDVRGDADLSLFWEHFWF